ncbi:lysylphosphatidylglycerol synthase transmembrane domain-containing protein [Desulfosediminicola sp.]|uniref:lysylphosphatidylglycerol synthase transmembrane domain-containing protein n=1 Tax=Desulfosediminicola sp. TaxID=2886825 RepID=UPI003AF23AF0
MRVRGTILIKFAFSILFFVLLFSFVRGSELVDVLRQIHWGYFLLSLLMGPAVLTASCLKWRLILVHGDKRVSFARLLQIYCIGYFFSNILPSTVGGDVVRAYYGGNEINDQVYSAISVFIERFSGLIFLLLLVLMMPLLRPALYQNPTVFVTSLSGFAGLVVISVLIFVPSITDRMLRVGNVLTSNIILWLNGLKMARVARMATRLEDVIRFVAAKTDKVRHRLHLAWQTMSKDKTFLFKLITLTLMFYVIAILNVYFSFKAFGVHVELLLVAILVPAALFFAHLPVTILGNLGYFESVFVIFFMIAGVPPAESLVMGLLLRFKMFLLGIVGMIFYFTFAGGDKKKPGKLVSPLKNALYSEQLIEKTTDSVDCPL